MSWWWHFFVLNSELDLYNSLLLCDCFWFLQSWWCCTDVLSMGQFMDLLSLVKKMWETFLAQIERSFNDPIQKIIVKIQRKESSNSKNRKLSISSWPENFTKKRCWIVLIHKAINAGFLTINDYHKVHVRMQVWREEDEYTKWLSQNTPPYHSSNVLVLWGKELSAHKLRQTTSFLFAANNKKSANHHHDKQSSQAQATLFSKVHQKRPRNSTQNSNRHHLRAWVHSSTALGQRTKTPFPRWKVRFGSDIHYKADYCIWVSKHGLRTSLQEYTPLHYWFFQFLPPSSSASAPTPLFQQKHEFELSTIQSLRRTILSWFGPFELAIQQCCQRKLSLLWPSPTPVWANSSLLSICSSMALTKRWTCGCCEL